MAAEYIMTPDDIRSAFDLTSTAYHPTWDNDGKGDTGNAILVDDPFPNPDGTNRGTVLAVQHYYGQYKLGVTDSAITGVPARPSGFTAYMTNPFPADLQEVYWAMDMAVPIGFKHNWACHLMDVLGPYFRAGTDPSTLGLNLAAFMQIGSPGECCSFPLSPSTFNHADFPGTLSCYYYDANKQQGHYFFNPLDPTDPDTNGRDLLPGQYQQLIEGEWNRIEMHIKLNTTGFTVGGDGSANGILQAWHNNKLMLDINGIQWVNQDTINAGYDKLTRSQFQTWYGGSDVRWACHEDQRIYFDNLIISESRIGG